MVGRAITPADREASGTTQMWSPRMPRTRAYIGAGVIVRQA
jgi:hypothetical protein